jgi:protein phosphatase
MSATWGTSEFGSAIRSFIDSVSGGIPAIAVGDVPLTLPTMHLDFVVRLLKGVVRLFAQDPVVLDLTGPLIIVGDLHGQFLDLIRILETYGPPGEWKYLFLGDLIDRGQFSIEVLIVVFLMKALFPTQVFVLRGNHEFSELCSQQGFLTQVLEMYAMTVYDLALDAFAELPLAAVLEGQVLCAHAGIGPDLANVAQIRAMARPIDSFDDSIVASLVWNDPSETVGLFEPSPLRGIGHVFGGEALTEFLRASDLQMLIRAHECPATGARYSLGERVLTVFSASNYGGVSANPSAVVEYLSFKAMRIHSFAPLPWLLRESVAFDNAEFRLVTPLSMRIPSGLARMKPKRLQPFDVAQLRALASVRSASMSAVLRSWNARREDGDGESSRAILVRVHPRKPPPVRLD